MSIITFFTRCCVSTLLFSLFINSVQSKSFYRLDTTYAGDSFFDGFDFFTDPDPTHGFVKYEDRDTAKSLGLIASGNQLAAYMGVDHINTLNSFTGPGRSSVRIESKKSFTHGLIISDIAHMPGGICGTWPAHWTLGPDWPNNGEIDIIEEVNSATKNLMGLHTSPNCTIAGSNEQGVLQSNDCDTTKNYNQGCGVLSSTTTSYGTGFNEAGGGVYATEWTASYIRIWLFQGNIPADIKSGHPDPSLWGLPQANFQGSCDIDSHFKSHRIVFDNTFCGDFAGTMFPSDPTCGLLAGGNCAAYVANNPTAFTNAYWSVNSVKVYKLIDLVEINYTPGVVPAQETAVPAPLSSAMPQTSVLAPGMGVAISTAMPSVASQKARVGSFNFVSCAGLSSNPTNLVQVDDSPKMTVESCLSSCSKYLYGGMSNTKCFCANTMDQSITLVASGLCSTPCPGDASEICGASGVGAKRQVRVTFFLSLYKNAAYENAAPSPIVPFTPLISAVPARQVLGYGMGGGADISLFVNVTVNATYVDVCNTCPSGVTTVTSTYTYQHCGCMDVPLPTPAPPPIPMTAVVKECDVCNNGGPGTTTLTTPCEALSTSTPIVTDLVVNFKGGITGSVNTDATKTVRIAVFTGNAGKIAAGWAAGVAVALVVTALGF